MSQALSLPEKKIHLTRVPALDLLRTVGISVIGFGHYLQFKNFRTLVTDHFGYLAMNLFFVLSGFLIGGLVFSEIQNTKKLNVLHFYLRRNSKLLPSFYFVLLLYFLVPSFREDIQGGMAPFWRFATFTQNYFSSYGTFVHAWSLCVEEQFYLIFPWIALILSKAKPKSSVIFFLGLIIFCAVLRLAIWKYLVAESVDIVKDFPNYLYFPTWARVDCLAFGCLTAYVRFFYPDFWVSAIANSRKNLLVFIFLLVVALLLQLNFLSWYGAAFTYLVTAGAFASLILYAANSQIRINRSPSFFVGLIAKLAYSIYLTHKMSFKITENFVTYIGLELSIPLYALFSFLVAMACAALLYYLIEYPMTKFARRFSV